MIKWICLIFVIWGAESADYRDCHRLSSRDRVILRCKGVGLGELPKTLPRGVTELDIKNDDLTGGFNLDDPSYKGLKQMKFQNVKIAHIRDRTFANLRQLEVLIIFGSHTDPINVTFDKRAFHGLVGLRQVRLAYLNITELPDNMFHDSTDLAKIYIFKTRIREIRRDMCSPLTKVEQLVIQDNEIETIEEGAFDCVNRDRFPYSRIMLAKNRLSSIPDDIVKKPPNYWTIHNNPIICDCNLPETLDIRDHNAVCSSPPNLEGVKIRTLDRSTLTCFCEVPEIEAGITHPSHEPLAAGQKLRIQCDEGFSLDFLPNLVCRSDGTFGDAQLPRCMEHSSEPEELEDGTLRLLSAGFAEHPGYVRLTCPSGASLFSCRCKEYHCRGVHLRSDGCDVYAGPDTPTRAELICLPHDQIANSYIYDSTAAFDNHASCRTGFTVTTCTAKQGAEETSVPNYGKIEKAVTGVCGTDCGSKRCTMQLSCISIIVKAQCDLFTLRDATISLEGRELTSTMRVVEGDVLTITCDEGYEQFLDDDIISTVSTVTCIVSDRYSPYIPDCSPIPAECVLREIPHVIANPDWVLYEGEVGTLSCGEGYTGDPVEVSCDYGGIFRDPEITCTELRLVECEVSQIADGTLSYYTGEVYRGPRITEGDILTLSCVEGFEPSNMHIRATCLRNGRLDVELGRCTAAIQPTIAPTTDTTMGMGTTPTQDECYVPLIRNGYAEGYRPGARIERGVVLTFRCDAGFQLLYPEANKLTCVSSQFYSPNKLPYCRKRQVQCTVPPLENGYYLYYKTGNNILNEEKLRANCFEGFELYGPEYLVCGSNEFGGAYNTCTKPDIDCIIPTIAHGQVLNDGRDFKKGASFPIVCDRGYYNPFTQIACYTPPHVYDPLSDFDCRLPRYGCPKVAFPFMEPLLDEPFRDQVINATCLEGYILIGNPILTCGRHGDYKEEVLPQCTPEAGCDVPSIENGVTNTSLSHVSNQEVIEIICDDDHMLYGDLFVTCQEGTLSGLITPRCVPDNEMQTDCILPIIYDGEFWPLADDIINPGSTLVLQCYDGFGAEGPSQIKCITRAVFEPAVLPQCVPLDIDRCPPYELEHGTATPSDGVDVRQSIRLSCEEGYMLLGPEVMLCRGDGSYEEEPVCAEEPSQCSTPNILFGMVSPNQAIDEGQKYIVICNDGHELQGDQIIICGTDGALFGETLGSLPVCRLIPKPCDKPFIWNGWITFEQEETQLPEQESTYVICNQPNYGPAQTMVTCMGDNVWRPSIPECKWQGPTCTVPTIDNAILEPDIQELVPWEDIAITCREGFEKNPKVNLTCLYKNDTVAELSKVPACEQTRSQCVRPTVQDGFINGPDPLLTDDRFTVECDEGFELVGVRGPLVCYQDSIYSRNLPLCQQKNDNVTECAKPLIQNGNIIGTPLTGYYITVVCDEGYSIQGSSRLQCLQTGSYDQQVPQCVEKDHQASRECGERDPQFFGKILLGNDTHPGEYPWNVFIQLSRGRFCGGSIVDKNWVLTASHCLLNNIYYRCSNQEKTECAQISPRDVISITAGAHNKLQRSEPHVQVRRATKIVMHSKFIYERNYIDNDVGLIKVDIPFEYTAYVNRVCLPETGTGVLLGNKALHVSGWGKTEKSLSSNILQRIIIPYIDRDTCNAEISYDGLITETMFCAGFPTGKIDACQGDSGGPLVYLGPNGTMVQGGVISWGNQCGVAHFYGVYTNLAYFYNWVMGYIISENN